MALSDRTIMHCEPYPATRGQSVCFGITFLGVPMLSIFRCSQDTSMLRIFRLFHALKIVDLLTKQFIKYYSLWGFFFWVHILRLFVFFCLRCSETNGMAPGADGTHSKRYLRCNQCCMRRHHSGMFLGNASMFFLKLSVCCHVPLVTDGALTALCFRTRRELKATQE